MELKDALLVLMSPGSGGVVFWLVEKVPYLAYLTPDRKRFASMVLSVVLPLVGWGLMLLLGYDQVPATLVGVVEKVFGLVGASYFVSQGAHWVQMRRKRAGAE